MYSVARLCSDQTFSLLCHRRHVTALCMLYKVIRTRIIVCSVSFHQLLSELTYRAAAAAHPLVFEVSRCRTSKFAGCLPPAQIHFWNALPYTVFDTGTLLLLLLSKKVAVQGW